MRNAAHKAREKYPDLPIEGELQFDAAVSPRVGNFEAYGPILLGLNAPINDLSRGCNASEVYSMAIITAALA